MGIRVTPGICGMHLRMDRAAGESGLEDSRVRGVQKYDKMRREIC